MAKSGYTVAQAADILGVSKATIHNWMGRFPNAWQIDESKTTSAVIIPASDLVKVRDEELEKQREKLDEIKKQIAKLSKAELAE